MPAERTPTKASELRRSTKPIMEKRRRARINNSLTELKTLILDALKKDNARHSKLEKADILEMTVKHLQQLQRQQRLQPTIPDPDAVGKFRAGFGACAAEVSRYLNREQADDILRQRLLGHLANCLTSLAPTTPTYYGQPPPSPVSSPNPHQTALPTVRPSVMADMKPVHVQVPADHLTIGNGLQLVATKLPSGEIAFLLPGKRDSNNTTSVITHAKQRCPVNVLGSSGILSPAASDRSSPSPSSPLTVTMPYHGGQPVFEPISPAPSSTESVWRPW